MDLNHPDGKTAKWSDAGLLRLVDNAISKNDFRFVVVVLARSSPSQIVDLLMLALLQASDIKHARLFANLISEFCPGGDLVSRTALECLSDQECSAFSRLGDPYGLQMAAHRRLTWGLEPFSPAK